MFLLGAVNLFAALSIKWCGISASHWKGWKLICLFWISYLDSAQLPYRTISQNYGCCETLWVLLLPWPWSPSPSGFDGHGIRNSDVLSSSKLLAVEGRLAKLGIKWIWADLQLFNSPGPEAKEWMCLIVPVHRWWLCSWWQAEQTFPGIASSFCEIFPICYTA